ncbi:poly(3-hydroxybutyrate) depolymerase [Azotobacter armeniacus]
MKPLPPGAGPNTPVLVKYAALLAEYDYIVPLENLKDDHIYIFSGTRDKTGTPPVVNQTREFFKSIGVPEASIKYDKSADTSCPQAQPPFINDYDFEQPTVMLNQIYPGLKPPAGYLSSATIAFDQSEFIDWDYTSMSSMSNTAYAYVPTACQTGKSRPIHMVFHGCEQGAKVIGDKYYAQTDYNQMAEANDLIMLYPQVQPSSASPLNPEGCWDFWGYSSPGDPAPDDFTCNALRLRTIHKMITRLAEPRP